MQPRLFDDDGRRYQDYIQSPEWKLKREKVGWRDGWVCVMCKSNSLLECHHLNYSMFGKEPFKHLITLCKPCHNWADKIRKAEGEMELIGFLEFVFNFFMGLKVEDSPFPNRVFERWEYDPSDVTHWRIAINAWRAKQNEIERVVTSFSGADVMEMVIAKYKEHDGDPAFISLYSMFVTSPARWMVDEMLAWK